MQPNEFVIFAELKREKFEELVQALTVHFENIAFGRQGDDWIWIHFANDKIEIDSFYSLNLEVKGKYEQQTKARQILQLLESDWILKVFDPPKPDLTR